VHTDVLLGLVKEALRRRRGMKEHKNVFKVIVMSATLKVDAFMGYFKEFRPALCQVPGR